MCTNFIDNDIMHCSEIGDLVKKIRINYKINDVSQEILGNFENNIIYFTDNSHNNISFDYTKMTLTKNNDYLIDFINKVILIEKNIKFDIVVNKIICNNSEVKINYEIGDQIFNFSLSYTQDLKG